MFVFVHSIINLFDGLFVLSISLFQCFDTLISNPVIIVLVVVPVSVWRDEVETAVDAVVGQVPSVQPALVPVVLLELTLDV